MTVARQRGFSLIEALVSMLLGCLLVLAAVSVFLSSRRVMDASQGLTSVQEASRIAFELLGRDLREAGGNPCAAGLPYGNILNSAAAPWWAQVEAGVLGYGPSDATAGLAFGVAPGQRLAGTAAIDLHTALRQPEQQARVVAKMPADSANLEVSSSSAFAPGDLALVCDPVAAYVFQITAVQGSGRALQHNSGMGVPGNCVKHFGAINELCNNAGSGYLFGPNAMVTHIASVRWYVGPNTRGGTSLFRATLQAPLGLGNPVVSAVAEVAPDVAGMELQYLQAGSQAFVDAAAVGNWRTVMAVRARLILSALPSAAPGAEPIRRDSTQVVALRNRIL